MTNQVREDPDGGSDHAQGALSAGSYEAEDVFADAEEWSPAETKLVVWSFVAAGIALAIGGLLVNIYIL